MRRSSPSSPRRSGGRTPSRHGRPARPTESFRSPRTLPAEIVARDDNHARNNNELTLALATSPIGGPPLKRFAALRAIALAAFIAVLALGAAAPGANGAVLLNASESVGVARMSGPSARIAAPCSDRAYSLFGARWTHAVHWSFKASTVPPALNVDAVEAVIRRSFSNITGAHNDCGRADHVGAKHVYDGRTERSANISRYAGCKSGDGTNVVSFGRLPRGVLAVTCADISRGRIWEADIRINSRYSWAVSAARCSGQELLEPTITHEVGHVYGLGHVGERRHPLLTMSTASDGWCNDAASTLGLGDMLGLEALY